MYTCILNLAEPKLHSMYTHSESEYIMVYHVVVVVVVVDPLEGEVEHHSQP